MLPVKRKCLVCLPLHVWDRELDSRLLWAYSLAKLGFDVVVGHEYSLAKLYSLNIPIFHIGAGRPVHNDPRSTNWYPNILKAGGYVGLIYEEGINDLSQGPLRHFAGITLDSCINTSKIYGWSVAERKLAQAACPNQPTTDLISERYSLSCHSRLELLGKELGASYYEKAASSLLNIFGPFVLVSDNFGIEAFGRDKPLSYKKDWSQFSNKDDLNQLLTDRDKELSYAMRIREKFADFVYKAASAHPTINFIIRPHPVSNPIFWQSKFNALRNVTVIYQGTCEPWLFACSCLIHSGCTMGIQSMISNTTEIDISNLISDNRDGRLSSEISSNKPDSINSFNDALLNAIRTQAKQDPKPKTVNLRSLTELFLFFEQNIRNSGLSTYNEKVSDDDKIPYASMAQVIIEDCLEFNNQLTTELNDDLVSAALSLIPKYKPNYNKSRYWKLQEINSRLVSYNKLLSSFTNIQIRLKKANAHNVFLLTSR